MYNKSIYNLIAAILFLMPQTTFAQAPNLGTAANFVLFSTVGAVSNTGITHLTGNVGSNSGSSTGFGNVDGGMHDNDGVSAQAGTDLLLAYNQLNSTIPTFFPSPLLGNGQILVAGVYSIGAASTLNLDLTLDAQGDPNAVFIFQIQGSLSTGANAKVKLINGAQACKVFWKIEGLVSMGAGTFMRGTIIANNAAIIMNSLDTLEGRALSISGAVTVDGVLAYTPIGCGSAVLMGPLAPALASTACYALFTTTGPASNSGISYVTGDIGTNAGLTTGFNPLFVTGMVHPIPDGSTGAASADLLNVYNYLNVLPSDIELLYPAQFGNNLVLTPHTYILNGAASFTDTLYLNAQGSPNAVFVIHIFGALTTSAYSKVILINGAQSKNVYWVVDGAVQINDYSVFRGTIICNNGAIDLTTGVTLDGRAMTTVGSLTTAAVNVTMPLGCATLYAPTIITEPLNNQTVCNGDSTSISVIATGTGLTYQWRKGNVNLFNGGNISGTTTPTLTFHPIGVSDAAANYNVIVSGSASPSDTSNNASLTVRLAPNVVSEPSNQTVCTGNPATFSVAAVGTNLSYQWRKGNINLINSGTISGANSATLTINPSTVADTASNYSVIITGACLPSDTSILVALTVNTIPAITSIPTNQLICAGNSVSLPITATGTGIIYQWRKGNINLVNGGNISGTNTATLTINPTGVSNQALDYNVIVSGACLPNDTSSNIALTVSTPPSITTQPINQVVCEGNSVSFSSTAIGSNLTYQWRKGNINLSNSGTISGANSATLTINPSTIADTASNYNLIISGICLPNDTSVFASLTISAVPTITSVSNSQTVCSGSLVTFTATTTGSNLVYQWRKGNINLVNGGNISGATSPILSINPSNLSDSNSSYNLIISGVCLPNDTSINIALTVNTPPSITTEPSSQVSCEGNSVSFSSTAIGSNLTYQWRKGTTDLVDGGSISGANSATLTINPSTAADASANYNLIVSGICLPNDTSVFVFLAVNSIPRITSISNTQTVCAGSIVNFAVTATGSNLAYQWRKGNINLVNGGNISGANTNTLQINPSNTSNTASDYNVIVSGICLPNDTSIFSSLLVNPTPTVYLGADIIQTQLSAPAILNAGTGYTSYHWNTAETTQSIAVTQAGSYMVTISNMYNCTGTDTIQVHFTTTNLVNLDGSISTLSLYPNPSNGLVSLSIKNLETESLEIEVLDMTGRVLYRKYLGSVNGTIIEQFDFTHLTSGLYIVRSTANNQTVQSKLVISN